MTSNQSVPAPAIQKDISRKDFDEAVPGFVFGTATSAYQVEGAAAKGGRSLSVWDVFTLRTPGNIADGSNGNVAVDMYTRYKEDIKMMKNMGFDAFRFSISWPRILPGGKLCLGVNQEGLDFYNDLINTLLDNGIKPFVTLYHWDHPYTLEQEYGGWLSEEMVNDFRDFAELCFWEFGDRVKHWITLNEPVSYVVHGYVGCLTPPGKNAEKIITSYPDSDEDSETPVKPKTALISKSLVSDDRMSYKSNKRPGNNYFPMKGSIKPKNTIDAAKIGAPTEQFMSLLSEVAPDHQFVADYKTNIAKDAYIAGRNMLLAHAEAVHSYRTKFKDHQKGKIGITLVTHWFYPYDQTDNNDKAAVKRALDFMLGWFLEPVITGDYPKNMKDHVKNNLPEFSDKEKTKLQGSLDFLGLNYYTSYYAANDPNPEVTVGYNRDMHVRTHKKPKNGKKNKRIGSRCPGAKWLYVVPPGIYELLKYIKETYSDCPEIYITENGFADKNDHTITALEACRDELRKNYFRDHLYYVLEAIKKNNVDIKGYFAWTWCDNFEWRDGYSSRFGLIYIDYMNHLKRYPKDSAMWFTKFLLKEKDKNSLKSNPNQNQNQENPNQVPGQNPNQNPENPNPVPGQNPNQNQEKRTSSQSQNECGQENKNPNQNQENPNPVPGQNSNQNQENPNPVAGQNPNQNQENKTPSQSQNECGQENKNPNQNQENPNPVPGQNPNQNKENPNPVPGQNPNQNQENKTPSQSQNECGQENKNPNQNQENPNPVPGQNPNQNQENPNPVPGLNPNQNLENKTSSQRQNECGQENKNPSQNQNQNQKENQNSSKNEDKNKGKKENQGENKP